jgi:Cellulose binding domain
MPVPPRHSTRPLGPAQTVLSAAAAGLVLLVVWVAVRAVGPAEASRQPTVMMPTTLSLTTPPPTAAAPPAPRRTSASPSVRPSRTSHKPAVEKTTTKPAVAVTPTTKKPAPAVLNATLDVPASWDQGYVAAVRIKNTGATPQPFTVTVSNNGLSDVRLMGTWNARGTQSGDRLTFTGGPLAPGATATFGYQVSGHGRGPARPSGCSVVGGKCTMS